MNIIEAIKSGKRFKRKSWSILGWVESRNRTTLRFDNEAPYTASHTDLVADDWEVEEKKVEITASRFMEAINNMSIERSINREFVDALMEELGL